MTDPSPLSEASPKSLEELFSLDPLDLTRSDLETIVTELRKMREIWARSESGEGKRPRRSGANPRPLPASPEDLGLGDD